MKPHMTFAVSEMMKVPSALPQGPGPLPFTTKTGYPEESTGKNNGILYFSSTNDMQAYQGHNYLIAAW